MKPLDIAVAGCGPAGMAAALLLARQRHRVTIFERFERPQAVGSGLIVQPVGLAVLDHLGLGAAVRETGARITGLLGKAAPSGRTALHVRYEWLRRPGACGYGIHRAALFDILHAALLAAGIAVQGGRAATASEPVQSRRRLLLVDGAASRPYDLVVDALGASSPLSSGEGRPLHYGALWATLDRAGDFAPELLEQRYRRAEKMVGVLPIGRTERDGPDKVAFFWSLRHDRLEDWRAAGLDAWKDEVRQLWPATAPLLAQISDARQLTFARYTHRTLRRPAEPALIHIGDAWHATSPQLGQGANMALLDAWALAQGLGDEDDLARGLTRAITLRQRHVRLYQGLSRLFTPVYQSDGRFLPFVRDRIVPPFARLWPATLIQAQMVAGLFGGPLKPLGLEDQEWQRPSGSAAIS